MLFFTVFRWFRRVVYLVVLAAFVYLVITSVQVISASRAPTGVATVTNAPVIVVIGSATGADISADLKARCEVAYYLFNSRKSKMLIVTGASSSSTSPTEASVAASYLGQKKVRGVKQIKGIKQVPDSEIPAQLAAVAKLLPASAGGQVVLVVDPLQTKWVGEVAAAEGLHAQIVTAPAPKASFWSDAKLIWVQAIAVGLGRVFGYKNLGWVGA